MEDKSSNKMDFENCPHQYEWTYSIKSAGKQRHCLPGLHSDTQHPHFGSRLWTILQYFFLQEPQQKLREAYSRNDIKGDSDN